MLTSFGFASLPASFRWLATKASQAVITPVEPCRPVPTQLSLSLTRTIPANLRFACSGWQLPAAANNLFHHHRTLPTVQQCSGSNRLDRSWHRKPTYRTNHNAVRFASQDRCGEQCCHVDASHLRSFTSSAVPCDRTAHRSGRIQTNNNRSRQRRHVSTGDLGCLMQCSLDLLRNIVIGVQVRSKVLVRELLRIVESPTRLRSGHHVINHCTCCEHIVSQQSVQVHTQRLRTHLASQCSPNLRSLGGIRQQVPSDVVESTSDQCLCFFAFRVAVCDQRLNFDRKSSPPAVPTSRLLCQSTNRTSLGERYPSVSVEPFAGCPASSDRLPIDALSSFPTETVFIQRWNARCTELDKPTRPLPALFLELARPNHLEYSTQNATVIDHAIDPGVT